MLSRPGKMVSVPGKEKLGRDCDDSCLTVSLPKPARAKQWDGSPSPVAGSTLCSDVVCLGLSCRIVCEVPHEWTVFGFLSLLCPELSCDRITRLPINLLRVGFGELYDR